MKKVFLNCMLLLCALIVGSNVVWGATYTGKFKKITSTSEFTTGYYVVAASESASSNAGYALGNSVNSDKRMPGSAVTITDGTTITNPDNTVVWYITVSGTTITMKNVSNNNYLYQAGTSSGKGMGLTETSTNLTLAGYNNNSPIGFKITLNGASTNYFKYNASSKWFANYANEYSTSMTPVRLFKQVYSVTYSATNGTIAGVDAGSNTVSSGDFLAAGATVTLTATPEDGYTFSSWNVSGTGATLKSTTTNPTTLTMGSANATVTAVFSVIAGNYINSNPVHKDISCDGDVAIFSLTTNIASPTYSLEYYTTSTGDVTTSKPSWFGDVEFDENTLGVEINSNPGDARSAYFKVKSGDTYSPMITIDQDEFSVVKPSFDEAEGTYYTDLLIDITCATAGADIYYTTDGTDPSKSNGSLYDGEGVELKGNSTTTLKAIAYYGEYESEIESATYTIIHGTETVGKKITFDFTKSGAWGFPADYEATAKTYTADGKTISLGASSNGHKALVVSSVPKGLIFGKDGATLTLPAFDFAVQKIIVYGITNASTKVTFNIFVGEDAVSTQVTSSATDHEFVIAADKQAAGTIYTIKLTNDNNGQISKIEIYGYVPISISDATWASFSSVNDIEIPSGITAYIAPTEPSSDYITLEEVTGDYIPANTGVILHGSEAEYNAKAVPSQASLGDNLLQANTTAYALQPTTTEGLTTYYNYTLAVDGSKNPIFKHSTGTGNLAAGKAYLKTEWNAPNSAAPSIIRILDEDQNATNIKNVEANEKAVKFIENGRILIKKNGIVYDALGRVIR